MTNDLEIKSMAIFLSFTDNSNVCANEPAGWKDAYRKPRNGQLCDEPLQPTMAEQWLNNGGEAELTNAFCKLKEAASHA